VTGKSRKQAFERFCIARLGINLHSARYSFLVHGDERGLSPAQLSAITGQSIGMVERYLAHINGSKYLTELAKAPTA
jgi:hypothetical protein